MRRLERHTCYLTKKTQPQHTDTRAWIPHAKDRLQRRSTRARRRARDDAQQVGRQLVKGIDFGFIAVDTSKSLNIVNVRANNTASILELMRHGRTLMLKSTLPQQVQDSLRSPQRVLARTLPVPAPPEHHTKI